MTDLNITDTKRLADLLHDGACIQDCWAAEGKRLETPFSRVYIDPILRYAFNPHSDETCVALMEWLRKHHRKELDIAFEQILTTNILIPEAVASCVLKILDSEEKK